MEKPQKWDKGKTNGVMVNSESRVCLSSAFFRFPQNESMSTKNAQPLT